MNSELAEVEYGSYERREGEGKSLQIIVKAGRHRTERVVPPAGEQYAYDYERWDRRIEIYVSPTGRSVRVWIDGEEVAR